jgi:hypothetical protein
MHSARLTEASRVNGPCGFSELRWRMLNEAAPQRVAARQAVCRLLSGGLLAALSAYGPIRKVRGRDAS